MKHLKLFQTEAEYTAYKNGGDFITPNVSYTVDSTKTFYSAFEEKLSQNAGDIVYYDGSSLKTIQASQYNDDLGTAVGVIVIPEGMLPDGKARFIALQNAAASHVTWGGYSTDTSLTNHKKVPTTDNIGSTTTSSSNKGYLPSDNNSFTGETSYVDSKTKYYGFTPYIPSPYLADGSLNSAYCEVISDNNALSDFNGKSNTDILIGLGTDYKAVNDAKNYVVDGVDIDWYLPAAGELGFLVSRFAVINESITVAGGVAVREIECHWSSTEYNSTNAYSVNMNGGLVSWNLKNANNYVRSFAMLD